MTEMQSEVEFGGRLTPHHTPPPPRRSHQAVGIRVPFTRKRFWFTDDPGRSTLISKQEMVSQLFATHTWPDGSQDHYDFGSGLITNVGVMALVNDFAWAQNCQTLKLANYHASGTGTTADAATDIALQTLAAPTATTAVAGTQTAVIAANLQKYQTVATLNYTSTLAITEWGLHTAAALSATTGSPFTATSGTSATATATPFTASSATVQGEQQLIVKAGTTASYGLILSNTTSVLTIPAWFKVVDGTAGTTPGATEAYTLLPVLFDRRVISAINVISGSSITFTYLATASSGG